MGQNTEILSGIKTLQIIYNITALATIAKQNAK